MNTEQTRRAWVTAVLEGRLATADYLAPDLPPVGTDDVRRPPTDSRESFAVAGEICTAGE
ncbi:MAG TPA: hypothetical protein VMW52_11525 [Phycisphaerae bacterium]|nr:hypothetical protein [Phycisphaerae bacterium]